MLKVALAMALETVKQKKEYELLLEADANIEKDEERTKNHLLSVKNQVQMKQDAEDGKDETCLGSEGLDVATDEQAPTTTTATTTTTMV